MPSLQDAPPFLLSVGDPGLFPEPPGAPPCWEGCRCTPAADPVQPPDHWATPGVPPPATATSPLLTDLRTVLDAPAG